MIRSFLLIVVLLLLTNFQVAHSQKVVDEGRLLRVLRRGGAIGEYHEGA